MGTLTNTTAEVQVALDGAFASIYLDGGSTAQSIANGASYVKSTGFATNGNSSNMTTDVANDKVTATVAGTYQVNVSCSFTGDTNNTNWFGAIFVDGVEQGNIHFQRKIGAAADVGTANASGLVHITSVPVDIDFRLRHGGVAAEDFTPVYMNLSAHLTGQ